MAKSSKGGRTTGEMLNEAVSEMRCESCEGTVFDTMRRVMAPVTTTSNQFGKMIVAKGIGSGKRSN